jgi:hypothetical protein
VKENGVNWVKRLAIAVALISIPSALVALTCDTVTPREAIIGEIWSGAGLPGGVDDNAVTVPNPMPITPSNLLRVDAITTEVAGKSFVNHVFYPKVSNGKLVLLGGGHASAYTIWNNALGYKEMASDLIAAGYTVAAIYMPFAVDDSLLTVKNHNTLTATNQFSGLRYFLEPPIKIINKFAGSFSEIYVVGKSGGGWLANVLSAIDTRITKSVSVAGSMPMSFSDAAWSGKRDWEQKLPRLLATYEDLYVMATDGGRKQLMIYNLGDTCCFKGSDYNAKPFGGAIAMQTGGRWSVLVDNVNQHTISPWARSKILAFFGS